MNMTSNTGTPQTGNDPNVRPAHGDRIKDVGKEAAARVKDEAQSKLEQGKRSAAAAAGNTSAALDQAASTLSADGQETLAQAASLLADKLSRFGHYVETHSLNELTNEARSLARKNPALFIAGGVALGLALSRFVKASSGSHESSEDSSNYDHQGDSI